MKSLEKFVLLILPIICFSWEIQGFGNVDSDNGDGSSDFLLAQSSGGSEGFISSSSFEPWDELKEKFQYSLLVCQNGIEEASLKLKELFDVFSEENFNIKVKGSRNLEKKVEAFDDFIDENDEFYEIENIFRETANEIKDEQFSVLSEDPKFGKQYINHVEKILRAVEHACLSLPKVLPNSHLRFSRSPEETMRRIIFSLTNWTERWVEYIETKLDKMIDICIANKPCKPFLIKSIERLITHLQNENGNKEFSASAQNILQEIVNEIIADRSIDPRPLSHVQKIVLSDYFDKFQMQEESAYNLAANIYDIEDVESSNIFDDVLVSSMLKMPRTSFSFMSAAELEIESKNAVHVVKDTFLSVGIGSSLVQKHWSGLKKKYAKLVSLASALSPSILRVGGSDANFLIFDPSQTNDRENEIEDAYMENKFVFSEKHPKKKAKNREILESIKFAREKDPSSSNHPKHRTEYQISLDQMKFTEGLYSNEHRCKPQDSKNLSNFTMTGDDMNFLIQLSDDLGWSLLFDLNQFLRDANDEWDPTNAKAIINALKASKNSAILQIGNEPNSYHHSYNRTVSPQQAAHDYKELKEKLLDASQIIKVVGPEVTRPRNIADIEEFMEGERAGLDSMEFLEKFLKKAGDSIDAVTWHQYYMNGRTATLEDFISPSIMNLFPRQLDKIIEIRNDLAPNKPIWITETASAWGGGAYGLSNSFVGGFLWLDKLGAAALGGAEIVVRQTLYGGCYALLDELLEPVPNYWISLLHKMLVGQKVLLPRTRLAPDSIRIYAHCLNSKLRWYKKGAVVIFGMNISDRPQKIKLVGEELKKSNILKFDLTASEEDLVSRHLLLNEKLLELTTGGELPELIPTKEENNGYLTFKPYSIQFSILVDAEAQAC